MVRRRYVLAVLTGVILFGDEPSLMIRFAGNGGNLGTEVGCAWVGFGT